MNLPPSFAVVVVPASYLGGAAYNILRICCFANKGAEVVILIFLISAFLFKYDNYSREIDPVTSGHYAPDG